jgi:outer membrane protein assembly factor BamD
MAFHTTRARLSATDAAVVRPLLAFVVAGTIGVLSACASGPMRPPTGLPDPDRFLYDNGTERLNRRDWFTAREYFRQLVDSYPQSEFRPLAKLGIGDTYLGEGTAESYVLGINEFREFLSFYPVHARADYAQFKIGMAHFQQMRSPMRDQTETLEAIKELTAFLERYPPFPSDHPQHAVRQDLVDQARARLRDAKNRIGEHELGVGVQYHRTRWYPGAIERLRGLLEKDPEFHRRDAALYYLADSYDKMGRPAEALPYYDRLLKEFEQSEYLERARTRWTAIRETMDMDRDTGVS